MPLIRLALLPRFIVYTASIVLTLLLAVLMRVYPGHTDVLFLLLVLSGGLAVLGTYDLVQTKHSVLRNYPVTAHLRFLLEEVRPEMRQYFFEGDNEAAPFSRQQRALVYQRAKGARQATVRHAGGCLP